ncbi:DUF805 domain-containing protein [Hyphobacterium sp.]|uniref:DUF805 domain-containing protein n=1 Tax=Hyphobacterium sp. TaxID=2004662 RepID=UPI00374A6D1B
MDVISRMLSVAFSLRGRTKRYDFWYFFAFLALLGLLITMLIALIDINSTRLGGSSAPLVFSAYGIVSLVLLFFAGARRLEDARYSSAWIALMFLGPLGWLILMRLWILPTARRKPNAKSGV